MALDSNHKATLLASLALGTFSLLVVPAYNFFTGILTFGEAALLVPLFLFLAPYMILRGQRYRWAAPVLFGVGLLFIVPVVVTGGAGGGLVGAVAGLVIIVAISIIFIRNRSVDVALSLISAGLLLVDSRIFTFLTMGFLSFEKTAGCTLTGGNCLDHNLFHLSHVPFYLVMIVFGYRAHRSKGMSQRTPRIEDSATAVLGAGFHLSGFLD